MRTVGGGIGTVGGGIGTVGGGMRTVGGGMRTVGGGMMETLRRKKSLLFNEISSVNYKNQRFSALKVHYVAFLI
jgi:hypothetical protein